MIKVSAMGVKLFSDENDPHFHDALWSGISLGMCPAKEKRRYNVTTFLLGWAHTENIVCEMAAIPFCPGEEEFRIWR